MKTIILACLAITLPCMGYAEERPIAADQSVIKESLSIYSVLLGTAFQQVDTPKVSGSWLVEVQNLSTEQVCCAATALATTVVGSATSCVRIDTASNGTVPRANDWKQWKRWAQNLSIFCRSLKTSGTAEIVVTQGK